jgi:RNA polymerase sigma-70 factor, ECF subfamily
MAGRSRRGQRQAAMSRRKTAAGEAALVETIARGDHRAFEAWIKQHNQRLFRIARSILRTNAEAEDAIQDAYFNAYRHIRESSGRSRPATWLTRIVINQALMRVRRQSRDRIVVPLAARAGAARPGHGPGTSGAPDPTGESPPAIALRAGVRRILERRIDELPVAFRTVFVMRDVEEMSMEETAECLGIPEGTVRSRLSRARALLREALANDLNCATLDLFGFADERCDRIVENVMRRLAKIAGTQR